MKKKNSILELWRFIAALIIVQYHCEIKFTSGLIFVEFFYMLTGYLTLRHFENKKDSVIDINNISKESLKYTYRKFICFIPYIFIVLLFNCIYQYFFVQGTPKTIFIDFIFETTLLSHSHGLDGPLWFLHALFIVFPLFCVICQLNKRYLLLILAILTSVIYYGNYYGNTIYTPGCYVRAFCGLMLGVIVYEIVELINSIQLDRRKDILATIIEELLLIFTVLSVYKGRDYYRLLILCFILGVALIMSKRSITNRVSVRVFDYLGKLSFIVYIVHKPLLEFLMDRNIELYRYDIIVTIASVIIAIVLNFIVEFIGKIYWKIKDNNSRGIYE